MCVCVCVCVCVCAGGDQSCPQFSLHTAGGDGTQTPAEVRGQRHHPRRPTELCESAEEGMATPTKCSEIDNVM